MGEISEAEGRRNKRLNLEEREDRISALPDSVLHHILSFLPSTKEAIQTGILSKRWQNQWTRVPVLIFIFDSGMRPSLFPRSIDSILLQHDCSKIKKLHLDYDFEEDTHFSEKIRFATRKHVEELVLDCDYDEDQSYMLPKFLFDNASLVKLEMIYCDFMDDWSINWGSLKSFKVQGSKTLFSSKKIANVLSGSPSLELLELNSEGHECHEYVYVIASKSLKILILRQLDFIDGRVFKIKCPNLKELSFKKHYMRDKAIENVVSGCLFLRSLELEICHIGRLVIASTSLKKLGLRNLRDRRLDVDGGGIAIEISCPNLEKLVCYGFDCETFKLMNIRSLICATLDFEISPYVGYGEDMDNSIFGQLQNVKELTLGSWFIKILSDVEMRGLSYPWLNNKILTLNGPNFEHPPGIVCALRSSPMLERLVIKLQYYKCRTTADFSDLNASREKNYWNSNGIVVNCLLSHLKTVEIIGFSKEDAKCELVLNFIKFLLENARVLEKLVLSVTDYRGTDFAFTVAQKVLSFPRCSQHAIVELYK